MACSGARRALEQAVGWHGQSEDWPGTSAHPRGGGVKLSARGRMADCLCEREVGRSMVLPFMRIRQRL